jgi:hypothetical protein
MCLLAVAQRDLAPFAVRELFPCNSNVILGIWSTTGTEPQLYSGCELQSTLAGAVEWQLITCHVFTLCWCGPKGNLPYCILVLVYRRRPGRIYASGSGAGLPCYHLPVRVQIFSPHSPHCTLPSHLQARPWACSRTRQWCQATSTTTCLTVCCFAHHTCALPFSSIRFAGAGLGLLTHQAVVPGQLLLVSQCADFLTAPVLCPIFTSAGAASGVSTNQAVVPGQIHNHLPASVLFCSPHLHSALSPHRHIVTLLQARAWACSRTRLWCLVSCCW